MRWLCVLCVVGCNQEAAAPPSKLEFVDARQAADVAPLIVEQLAAAKRDHKQLIVYVGAS